MSALLLVDLQNDFFPGGALAIKQGNEVLPVVEELLKLPFVKVLASQDFHPPDHISFARRHRKKIGETINVGEILQTLWPPHCIMGTFGAEFVSGLNKEKVDKIFYKGIDSDCDSYSVFYDNLHRKPSTLYPYLQKEGIGHIVVAGLATDYCVKESVLDALKLGLQVTVIQDGCRGVDLDEGDSDKAFQEMRAKGAKVRSFNEFKIAGVE